MTMIYSEKYPKLAKEDTLFIHGNLASTVWWKPTLAEWQKAGSLGNGDLIFADWRGCGRNPAWPIDKQFTIEELAQDFLDLIKQMGKEKVAVVGHSLGGLIALQMMLIDPAKVSKAVLLDPVGADGVVFDDSMYDAFKQMALNRNLTEMVIMSTVKDQSHFTPELTKAVVDDAFKAVQGIGSSVLQILKSVRLSDQVAQIKNPTLLLHGRHDQIIPLKDSEDLSKKLPNVTFEVLEEAGHCWNVENPSAFVKRLRAWF